ncbi:MAG TPA: carboxypeptidase regulatory-like domain-containing protein [Bryobacteraceae bacterium]|nr:carboxypeptidase regulatory-like domain-containing protein [Bryobacteraceae bacterium]
MFRLFSNAIRAKGGKTTTRLVTARILESRGRSSSFGFALVVIAVLSFLFSVSLFGQAVNSTLLGTVTDSSGGSVSGAQITLTESNTNVSRSGKTNDSGNFVFPDLPPGKYSVAVEMTGFKKEQRNGISLLVNTTQRVDVQLQPGNVTETVEVTGAPPELQTDRADTGRNIDSMVVAELPVLVSNRNYQALLALVPGTAPPTEEHSQFFNASDSLQTEVNGAPRVANNYQIEGIDDNERTGLLQVLIPPLEAIQTVDVSTSNHSVDLGRGAGAVTNVILKSGTNDFHGSLYEFFQNSDLDSRNFFQPKVAAVHYNYVGGTIGGPIKKNKLFFFADYLRTMDHEANANTETIPSPLSRTGNLSEALAGSSPAPVYDPQTGNSTTGVGRTPFPGNVIPTSRLNPIAMKILALVPNPNQAYNTAAPSNNYFALLPFTKDTDFADGKVDYTISEKDHLSGRFSFQRPLIYQAPIFGPAGGDANGAFEGTGVQKTYSSGINWTHIFSPTLLNEFRFGVAHYHNTAQESDYGTNDSTNLGIPGINISQFDSGLVGIGIGGFTSPLVGYSASLPWVRAEANIDLVDNVTKTHGNHTFTFGYDMRRIRDDLLQTQTYSPRGFYQFGVSQTNCAGSCSLANGTTSSATTPNPTTSWANDLGSFLLDSPQASSTGRDFSGTFPTYRAWYFFPYAADRWQISKKLTLSVGVRWEIYPPGLPAFPGQFSNFIPWNNTLVVGGVAGNPNNGGLVNHWNYIAPRVGLAYRLTEKTVIRTGIGVSYTPFEDNTYINNNYPTKGNIGAVQGASAYTSALYSGSVLSFESGLPVPAPQPIPSNGVYSVAALGFNGSTEDYFPANQKNPHIIAWNFTVQQALPAHFTMDVAYVGNHGVDMGSSQNINGSPVIAPASSGDTAYLPYFPHTGTISEYFQGVSAMYNGLQVKVDRRFGNGLSITSSLSYQKGMAYYNGGDDDGFYGFYLNGQYHRNWGLNDFNRTISFVQSYVYQLPFGKGKPFLNSSRVLDKVIGGWQIEGVLTAMTGLPFTVTYSSTYLNLNQGGTNTPELIDPNVKILHGINTTSNGGSPWFDPTAFAPPPCQSATPSASCSTGAADQIAGAAQQVGNIGRNSLIGPGFFNLNAALSKTTQFGERVAMQFRLETVNTTNTPQFANPNTGCCTSNNANFGFVTGTLSSGSGSVNAGTGGPRSVQLAVKITF